MHGESVAPAMAEGPILVAGATGDLGGRVVDALLARGEPVRALVRPTSDASKLEARGVAIARGDLTDPASLDRALEGASAVVTTAAGYMKRKRGDSLQAVDDRGNRNLVAAARKADVDRFVFTSILTCDQAPDVPHFWQKKLIEDELERSGVPFVALRPGAFLGGESARFFLRGLDKGKVASFASPDARWTYVHPDDVARAAAIAVREPRAAGARIDLGADRPASARDLAAVFGGLLGRPVRVDPTIGRVLKIVGPPASLVSSMMKDGLAMGRYFETGKYVADTTRQRELFGEVPTLEGTAKRALVDLGLAPSA